MSVSVLTLARIELRHATAAVHERLHHIPVFAALAAGRLDRGGYISLLGRLYGFHDPLEAAVAQAGPPGLQFAQWRRAHLLRSDLAALGQSEAAIEALPRHTVPGSGWSPAYAMGCLYVIEGSTLGGQHLARHLGHVLPADDMAGRAFLLAGNDQNHVGWRDFCAALNACGADPAPRAEMIAGAMEAFHCFEAWFA
jgi:heme oxygenase